MKGRVVSHAVIRKQLAVRHSPGSAATRSKSCCAALAQLARARLCVPVQAADGPSPPVLRSRKSNKTRSTSRSSSCVARITAAVPERSARSETSSARRSISATNSRFSVARRAMRLFFFLLAISAFPGSRRALELEQPTYHLPRRPPDGPCRLGSAPCAWQPDVRRQRSSKASPLLRRLA